MLRLDNLPQPRPWKEALNEYINSCNKRNARLPSSRALFCVPQK